MLSKPKRMIRLIIAEILPMVSVVATATTAAVALCQFVQTAQCVNDWSKKC